MQFHIRQFVAAGAVLLTWAAHSQTAPDLRACPTKVPATARCYTGEDGRGSYYWIAIPQDWNRRVLVMHAHGGPTATGPARRARSLEDLTRWAVTVKAGHAWAGSTYRRGGYGVTMAVQDTERLRQIFVKQFGEPRRTLLHGNSYGAGVAAKAAELYATVDGKRGPYDGILLTSGMLDGGVLAYGFRLDLRVVYQFVCKNHPRPEEPTYPLWMGLAPDSKLTRSDLAARVDECTGVRKPAVQRSDAQKANLATILDVVKIREHSLIGHLNWATWMFHDITQFRLGGRNPFDNVGAMYRGSSDDAALNAGVARYAADPEALADLAADSAPQGRVNIPVLTLHAIDDPIAFVELESTYRDVLRHAGAGELLVQTFTNESEHSFLANAQYPAAFRALLEWIDNGEKPTPQTVLALCKSYEATFGTGCHIRPEYQPEPLESRVPPR